MVSIMGIFKKHTLEANTEDPFIQNDPLPSISFDAFKGDPIKAFAKYNARPGEIRMDNGSLYFECTKDSVTPNEDRLNPAQKVELVGMLSNGQVIIEKEGTVIYGLRIKLASDWITTKTHCTFLQVHKVDTDKVNTKPALALSTELNGIVLKVRGGNIDTRVLSDKEINLTDNSLALGRFISLAIKVCYDKINGSVEVWRKDEGELSFTPVASVLGVPTVFYNKVGVVPLVFHCGIYRKPETFISKMWIAKILRGTNLDEIKSLI